MLVIVAGAGLGGVCSSPAACCAVDAGPFDAGVVAVPQEASRVASNMVVERHVRSRITFFTIRSLSKICGPHSERGKNRLNRAHGIAHRSTNRCIALERRPCGLRAPTALAGHDQQLVVHPALIRDSAGSASVPAPPVASLRYWYMGQLATTVDGHLFAQCIEQHRLEGKLQAVLCRLPRWVCTHI